MSLAPASIRGARLKARLAVNGIQYAARSFGTLTAAGRGLLSNMGSLLLFPARWLRASYQLHPTTETGKSGPYFNSIGRFEGAQGDVQGVDEAFRIVGKFDRPVQLLAKRLDQPGSEASPGRAWTAGPPFSVQVRCSHPFFSSMVQTISIRPAGTDSAPNFVVLVQSSLSVIASAITAPDVILRSGP